jgi:hypothetical protein
MNELGTYPYSGFANGLCRFRHLAFAVDDMFGDICQLDEHFICIKDF